MIIPALTKSAKEMVETFLTIIKYLFQTVSHTFYTTVYSFVASIKTDWPELSF